MATHCFPFLRMLYFVKNIKISRIFSEDISFAEYTMLQMINEIQDESGSPDVWVSDIVKRVEVTPQAVSKFINLNEQKGYLERFDNISDRRSTGIHITDLGMAVLRKTEEELAAFRASVFSEFSEEEVSTLHRLMNKIQIAVQENYLQFKKK
jgi:DNA-binding MarR family transcriptional regulator